MKIEKHPTSDWHKIVGHNQDEFVLCPKWMVEAIKVLKKTKGSKNMKCKNCWQCNPVIAHKPYCPVKSKYMTTEEINKENNCEGYNRLLRPLA
jgi:hypothetical protein